VHVVVVPTYEEAGNIASLLREIRAAAPDVRVIVVDDNSADGTADIAEATGTEIGGVEVLRRSGKGGLGGAYRAGFMRALEQGAEIVASMDADFSHDPVALPTLIAIVEDGADVAIGSRYVPGGGVVNWPAPRRTLSRWGNQYATVALGLPAADTTSGYRAYRASVVEEMARGGVRASGYGFLIEIAYRVTRKGGKLVESPITFVDRRWGASKMSTRSILEAAALVSLWGARDRAWGFFDRRRLGR
jgi:glycosyltransferase involved in cell wall biosynthesis